MCARFRVGYRFTVFALLTLWCYSVRRLARWRGRRDPEWERRYRADWMRRWGLHLMRLLRIRVTVHGEVPETPFLLVSNHLSYLDIPLLASLRGSLFVSKQDVAEWPLIGPVVTAYDTLYVDRENRRCLADVNSAILERFHAGDAVTIFPEGTSTSGQTVLPLMPSLLDAAARESIPVHYATIAYRTPSGSPPAATHVCWWGDMDFLPHFADLLRIPTFDAILDFGAEPIAGDNRKALARDLHDGMLQQFRTSDPQTSEKEATRL